MSSKNHVSGGMLTRLCDDSIMRSKVEPDRPEPTIKKGGALGLGLTGED